MAFPDSFLEELRNRLPLSGVVGRSVRLIKRGREFTGLCPFHNEKSPSFTVNDEKGFFHCFGCGAHGDVIGFTMRSSGLAFPEAVEQLAQEAGLAVPRVRQEDREKADQVATLGKAMEEAAKWFQAQLEAGVGAEGRSYIQKRGLKPETIERFRLGFAPNSRTALKEALLARGLPEPLLVEAGLLIKPEDGGATYDRFRNRVMFPIGDRRGRIIAFGGRALDPDAPAKYLNSPETPLFHKGRNLYNHAIAREAARESSAVVVVEGYMDVIALAQVGLDYAVAPLGTALTEEQIGLLWRLSNEPVLCFDGDSAGLRAAFRAADRILPLLEPGRSFRFAFLPEGKDPDDFVKEFGLEEFKNIVSSAKSLADVLWERTLAGKPLTTPEQRANVVQELKKLTSQIKDEVVRRFYDREFFERTGREFFTSQRSKFTPKPKHTEDTYSAFKFTEAYFRFKVKASLDNLLWNVVMAIRFNGNHISEELKENALNLDTENEDLGLLRDSIISASLNGQYGDEDSSTLSEYFKKKQTEYLQDTQQARFGAGALTPLFARPDADPAIAEDGVRNSLALYRLTVVLPGELDYYSRALVNVLNSNPKAGEYERVQNTLTAIKFEDRHLRKLVGAGYSEASLA